MAKLSYLPVFDPLGILERLTAGAPVQLKDPLRRNRADSPISGVKSEFGAPCWEAYNTALRSLRFLAGAHDIEAVMEALREDLNLV